MAATITHGSTLPDSSNKSDFYGIIDAATISGIVNAEISATAGITDGKLATITTAGKVSGAALTLLTSIPSGAGIIPTVNIEAVAWADYGATSTIVGWTSFTTKSIYYKKMGKTVFIAYHLVGTANAGTCTFTVPYTSAAGVDTAHSVGLAVDNGTVFSIPSYGVISASSATVNFGFGSSYSSWTPSGAKTMQGQFWYEAA